MTDNNNTGETPVPATRSHPIQRPSANLSSFGTADPLLPAGTQAQTPEEAAAVAARFGIRPDAVAGYEVLRELGRGGMGVVYLARDIRLNREVALKMILRTETDRMTVARFWAEAEVLAAVKHQNVVQVYEFGEYNGTPYMAMEFIPGGSLEKRLEHGRFPPHEAAELIANAASGVGAAHELGIVHRDLKPSNLLLNFDGRPKVTDFGIAKRKSHDLTQTNALMGTPAYMAPEQAAARAKFVGPTADVWALGVILYECVAGRRPFEGDSVAALFDQIKSIQPAALRTIERSVPTDLNTIVSKCLSKELEHRYPNAVELAADLGRFIRGEPIVARPLGPIERFARWVRRKPTEAAAYTFSALAILLTVVVFVVIGFWSEANSARDEAVRQKGIADAGRIEESRLRDIADSARLEALRLQGIAENAQAKETQTRKKLEVFEYGKTIQVAHQEYLSNKIASSIALLEGANPKLRGWEWRYVHRLCNSSLLTLNLEKRGHSVSAAAFSPDGSRIFSASWNGTAKVWDAQSGEELLTFKGHSKPLKSISLCADGSRVVTGSEDNSTRVWDTKSGTELLTLKGHTENTDQVSFSPDGMRIVTWGWGGKTPRVWDARTGAELLILKEHPESVEFAALNSDGSRLVTACNDGTVKVWDAKSGEDLLTLQRHLDPSYSTVTMGMVYSAAFSPDGLRIVTACKDGTARVWDAKTGRELLTLRGHTAHVNSVSFSADGSRIATASWDNTAKVWDANTGAELLTLKGHTFWVYSAWFSSDGSRILTASTDGTCKAWDARAGKEYTTLNHREGNSTEVYSSSFSSDGLRVVTASSDSMARVWDRKTANKLLILKGHTGVVFAATFSEDGSRIVTAGNDKTARVWDAKTGTELLILRGHFDGVNTAIFSPDGSRIVTSSGNDEDRSRDTSARVWDAKTGTMLLVFNGHSKGVTSAVFSPNGTRIVTGSLDGTAKVWDAKTGNELLTLKGHTERVTFASFSADGSRIVTASWDHTAKVWDGNTGTDLLTLKGHTNWVYSASFSSDGLRIITAGGSENLARIWDAGTGAEVLTLRSHNKIVRSASFSPDGLSIVTSSADGTARIWDSSPLDRQFLPKDRTTAPRSNSP